MKFLLVLSALLASLTGLGPVARAQGVGVEQVVARNVYAARAAQVQSAEWRQWARAFRVEIVTTQQVAIAPLSIRQFSERRLF